MRAEEHSTLRRRRERMEGQHGTTDPDNPLARLEALPGRMRALEQRLTAHESIHRELRRKLDETRAELRDERAARRDLEDRLDRRERQEQRDRAAQRAATEGR